SYRYSATIASAFVAPVLIQITRHGVRSMGNLADTLVNAFWGLVLSMILTYIVALRRGAENLDTELIRRSKEITDENSKLIEECERLRKPKRTPAQENDYREIKAIYDKYGDDEKTVLKHLRRQGKMIETSLSRTSPLPTGFSYERTAAVLNRLVADNIVTPE